MAYTKSAVSFKAYLIMSHYFLTDFASLLNISPFKTQLGTSEGIFFRKMYASLSCLRSKSDYIFRPEG